MNDKMSYQTFESKYSIVLTHMIRWSGDLSTEVVYRFFRLISGWVRDHDEYQLSQDFMTLSEWIGLEKLDPLMVDILINRWVVEGRKMDLHLVRMVVGGNNQKLDSLVGVVGNNVNGGGTKRNLSLVMKMGK
jgi:hypothetical protein